MNRYVVGFMFNTEKDYVILIQKNRPSWQAGKLNGVGGHIEAGELPKEAMAREFKEETSLDTNVSNWDWVCTMSNEHFECFVFRAFVDDFKGIKTTTDEKIIMSPVKLILPCLSNIPWLIAMCLDTNHGDFSTYSVIAKIGNYIPFGKEKGNG